MFILPKKCVKIWYFLFDTDYDEEGTGIGPESRKGETSLKDGASVPLPKAAVNHKVEVLLNDWNKGADMLFSIHPMDGSLLVWHVDWLDEYQPGMFRQAQVGKKYAMCFTGFNCTKVFSSSSKSIS